MKKKGIFYLKKKQYIFFALLTTITKKTEVRGHQVFAVHYQTAKAKGLCCQ